MNGKKFPSRAICVTNHQLNYISGDMALLQLLPRTALP